MDFMRVFSRNWFNLFDVVGLVFIFKFGRSITQMETTFCLVLVGSVILHLFAWSQRKRKTA